MIRSVTVAHVGITLNMPFSEIRISYTADHIRRIYMCEGSRATCRNSGLQAVDRVADGAPAKGGPLMGSTAVEPHEEDVIAAHEADPIHAAVGEARDMGIPCAIHLGFVGFCRFRTKFRTF